MDLRPKRVICCECHQQLERMRPVVRQSDGWIDYVCPRCWRQYDFPAFFFTIPQTVN